jgi:hypothetical protein
MSLILAILDAQLETKGLPHLHKELLGPTRLGHKGIFTTKVAMRGFIICILGSKVRHNPNLLLLMEGHVQSVEFPLDSSRMEQRGKNASE